MTVEISKQVRHWRDRSPYPGASYSHNPRNSTETNKPAEPVKTSTHIHSSEYTRNAPNQHNTEGLRVVPSYFLDEKSPEPVATRKPQTKIPMKRSVTWAPESSPTHQKAVKEHIRLMRSSTQPLQSEQEPHHEIVRVLSTSTQTHLDAKNRPRLRLQIPETPENTIVEQKTCNQVVDGTTPPHLVSQKAWLQLDDGIRSPRLVKRDPNSYHGVPFMTAMVEPEELDSIPLLSLGSPAVRPVGGSLKELSARSNGSSPAKTDNNDRNSSTEEKNTQSEGLFAFVDKCSQNSKDVQLVDELGGGESEEEDEEEHKAYKEEYEAGEEESGNDYEGESKVKVLLGFVTVLCLAFGADFYLGC